MNESDSGRLLDISLELAIRSFQHVVGIVMLLISIPVCFLIIFERDPRSREYRVYALSVQVFSMLGELWISMGVPIFLLNHGVVYCAGFVPFGMNSSLYACIFAGFFFELVNSYVSCIYYRRNTIIRDSSPNRWGKTGVLLLLRLYSTITLVSMYLLVERIQVERKNVSEEFSWLLNYPCVMFIIFNEFVLYLVVVLFCWAIPVLSFFYRLLSQSLHEVKNGSKFSSPSTRVYQRKAILALIVQALVPSIVFIIPIMTEVCILMYTHLVGSHSPLQNRTVATVSALIFSVISLHSIIHSITIVASSAAYRRTVLRIFCRRRFVHSLSSATVQQTIVAPILQK